MSAIDQVVAALQAVVDELDDAGNATAAARTEADEAVAQAIALGTTPAVTGLTSVKEIIDRLTQQLAVTADLANEAIGAARAVADGTL